ncbi:hypothetical protein [Lentzea aerocolonigenes]|uniref:hypothetical protein n=1 Tax=Lentzea aerocolonigenes TaxID=68170 RepID=UPI0012E3298E|nr:hypothetical protein [Lentzea aerocolonigenes]
MITKGVRAAPGERLWINPGRGPETRGYAEVEPALRNLVAASQRRGFTWADESATPRRDRFRSEVVKFPDGKDLAN